MEPLFKVGDKVKVKKREHPSYCLFRNRYPWLKYLSMILALIYAVFAMVYTTIHLLIPQ